MTELEERIIKKILENEEAMIIALEFIQKDQELRQAPSDAPLASLEQH